MHSAMIDRDTETGRSDAKTLSSKLQKPKAGTKTMDMLDDPRVSGRVRTHEEIKEMWEDYTWNNQCVE